MSELQFQINLFKALSRLEAFHTDLFTYAVEFGENNTNYVQLKQLKAKGMRRGVSDLHIMGGGKMLFVELKTATGVQSKFQKLFEQKARFNKIGYLLLRSNQSIEECTTLILKHLYG